jgi:hypothetical protein
VPDSPMTCVVRSMAKMWREFPTLGKLATPASAVKSHKRL